jgi:hypothetical protein
MSEDYDRIFSTTLSINISTVSLNRVFQNRKLTDYQVSSCSIIAFENLTVTKLVKKFPPQITFYQKFHYFASLSLSQPNI